MESSGRIYTIEGDHFFRNRTREQEWKKVHFSWCVLYFFFYHMYVFFILIKKVKLHTKVNPDSLCNLGLGVGGEFSPRTPKG